MEVVGPDGKVIGTMPSSKRRGLSRANWSMRVKGPTVPPAATADFGAARGPRVLPGTYTVRLAKDQSNYSTPLRIVPDPRVAYGVEDRKAQFDLAMKLHAQLGAMSAAVERINSTRLALDDRASKLPAADALGKRLRGASLQVDELRKRIVATKEGGMITGEERLREFLTSLYGNVMFYDGRPTQAQTERADALERELADVVRDFDAWAAKELPPINAGLAKKKLEPVQPLTTDEAAKRAELRGGRDEVAPARFERD
jgi:hypothetical protein